MHTNPRWPLIEALPYYMTAIGMQGARFNEGNPNGDKPPAPPEGTPPVPPAAAKDGDEKLGEGGIKALQAERDARAKAEKDLADAKAQLQQIEDAKLSDIEKAQKAAAATAAENAQLKLTNARLAALATHPVPPEYQVLVHGTDEASFLASAKLASELAAKAAGKPGVVHKSGTGGEDQSPSGGSLAAGRDLYNSKHKKTT